MSLEIISYIIIKDDRIWINDVEVEIDIIDNKFMKSIYNYLEIKYSKFYKMDELSKLGFVASELLLKDKKVIALIDKIDNNKIGVVLQNSDSTVDVDSSFFDLIADKENHHPSPALFVYTLPNISIGEISIYNKFRGENALFVSEQYNADLGISYIDTLLNKNKLDACIGGWFNANDANYEAFLYLVAKTETVQISNKHIKENIIKIYRN